MYELAIVSISLPLSFQYLTSAKPITVNTYRLFYFLYFIFYFAFLRDTDDFYTHFVIGLMSIAIINYSLSVQNVRIIEEIQ